MRRKTKPGSGLWLLLATAAVVLIAASLLARRGFERPDLSKYERPAGAATPVEEKEETPAVETVEQTPPEPENLPGPPPELALEEPAPEEPAPGQPAPAADAPREFDWARLTTRSDLWPKVVRLTVSEQFPVEVGGEFSGRVTIPPGNEVEVRGVFGDQIEVAHGQKIKRIPAAHTDLLAVLGDVDWSKERLPAPLPQAPATGEKPAEKPVLTPQAGWAKAALPDPAPSSELLNVLRANSRNSDDTSFESGTEIFAGVSYGMPLAGALQTLGLHRESLPSRSVSPNPSIPFFFRTFRLRSLPLNPLSPLADEGFGTVVVLTDANDRVVSLQFSSESPRGLPGPGTTTFSTYNFILNRRKALATLKVGSRVGEEGGCLRVETWLVDERRDPKSPGYCREVVRWYLPQALADFLRHVLEEQLGPPKGNP